MLFYFRWNPSKVPSTAESDIGDESAKSLAECLDKATDSIEVSFKVEFRQQWRGTEERFGWSTADVAFEVESGRKD